MRTIWYFFKPYKLYLLILIGFCLVNGLLESLHMAMMYPILSASMEKGVGSIDNPFFGTLMGAVEIIPINDAVIASCSLFIILTIVYSASRLFYIYLSSRFTAKIVKDYEQKVFQEYVQSDYSFFVNNKQGDLIYKGSQAPEFIEKTMSGLTRSTAEIILTVFVLLLLFSISWKGTIVLILFGTGYYFLTRYLSKRISYVSGQERRQASAEENVIMNEYITGVKQISATHSSTGWRHRFNKATVRKWKYWAINYFWIQVPKRLLELLLFFSIALIVIMMRLKYPDEFFSMIPMFGTFAFAVLKLSPKLSSTGATLMSISNGLPNLETVRELLTDKTYRQIKNGTIIFSGFKSKTEFRNVSFTYGKTQSTLRNLELTIEKNKMTAIVGQSGSGKSTIVDLLLRLYDADNGKILVDNVDLKDYDISTFRAKVGFVGQETFIFNASVRDNITFGNSYQEIEIVHAAKLANTHDFIEQLPNGYDTIVGDRGLKLSGGEKQRIAIARAMIRKPQFLILDEATSSLDNVSETVVQKAIDTVSETCTTLIIAHRLSTIRNADIIYVIHQGMIVENGAHEQLLTKKGKYWELYSSQVK